MKTKLYFTSISLLLIATNRADTFVVPQALANTEATQGSDVPFGVPVDARVEQVYPPSMFPTLLQSGQSFRLSEMDFRFNQYRPGLGGPDSYQTSQTFDDVQIYLSTSSAESYTTDLDQNHGPDKTLVYDARTTLAGTVVSQGSAAFDVKFSFSIPFDYDPSNGDLVLEIRKYGSETLGADLDAGAPFNDPGVPLNCCYFFAGPLNNTDNQGYGLAFVSQFTYTVVPEPRIWALFVAGMGALLMIQSRSKR